MNLKSYIRDVPDFPIPGILFRDITPLLQASEPFQFVINRLSELAKKAKAGAIIGIESRGFIFGAPVAYKLGIPFVPVRKPGKLPSARMGVEYALEYGTSQLDIHRDAISPGTQVVIIDDLLATGGTVHAAAKLVELIGGKVSMMLFVIELCGLQGRNRISDYSYEALVKYD